ncbi:GNAT family N-acetyltransferase [Dickeya zeae]|uniref:GNAT family N-acetyltransferase n=1 Tax=Dickeya zeae TaxID=204042 RepID=UPI000C9AF079|nr:GNAT family N-acetyltransferase [Dickeya zeae]AUQ24024.1 GNAT family N-acetyltransferase [Dickeya zeae]UJR57141.1 GNAT family N-acetyltransferase [Dickeya zeae]
MGVSVQIVRLDALPAALAVLIAESQQQGFRFLCRLQAEFQSGANDFRLPGEGLFAAFEAERLVAIGGVNQQTGMPQIGRLRRFYVAADYRRQGVGRELLTVIEQAAASYFRELYLFTDTPEAAQFYQRQRYTPVSLPDVSHRKTLAGVSS